MGRFWTWATASTARLAAIILAVCAALVGGSIAAVLVVTQVAQPAPAPPKGLGWDSPGPQAATVAEAGAQAIESCKTEISGRLKSPGSAQWVDLDSKAGSQMGLWTVTGSVDSQNGFGALMRTDFECTSKLTADGAASVVEYAHQR